MGNPCSHASTESAEASRRNGMAVAAGSFAALGITDCAVGDAVGGAEARRSHHGKSRSRGEALFRSGGFSLVELTAVLLVISILAVVILPDIESSNRSHRLHSAASEVMAALQFAQARSIHSGVSHGCETSMAANTLRCFEAVGAPPHATVTHPVRKGMYLIDFDASPGHGGIAITANSFPSETVTFDSLGSPGSGGAITVSLSGFSRRVNVTAISGLMEFSDP